MPGQPIELNPQHVKRFKLHPGAHTTSAFLSGASISSFIGSHRENARSLKVRAQALKAASTNNFRLVNGPDDICRVCLNFPCPFVAVSKRELREKVFQAVTDDPRFPVINSRRQRGLKKARYEFLDLIHNHWQEISSERSASGRSGIVSSTTNR